MTIFGRVDKWFGKKVPYYKSLGKFNPISDVLVAGDAVTKETEGYVRKATKNVGKKKSRAKRTAEVRKYNAKRRKTATKPKKKTIKKKKPTKKRK